MSQEIQEAVYKQQEVIKDKQLSVKQDLDQVEPAVIEAQNGMIVQFVAFLSTNVITVPFVTNMTFLKKNVLKSLHS